MSGWGWLGAVGAAAAVTYGLRVTGLLVSDWLPRKGPVRRALDALPGAILVSLVVPSAIHSGPWGLVATGVTACTALRTRNVFLAMLAGMAVMILRRRLWG